ncbi:hypothetical protein TM7_0381 [candidate division TM7 genomosp. GTL1]|nr:hypothetical protein TM7_0381 [candidate division TM7 genomosp. GTL1]
MIIVTFAVFGFVFNGQVSAAPPKTALAISPPLFELSANPGGTLKQSIRIDNLTDLALPITLDSKDFVALGEEGQATITDKKTSYSLASWIQLDATSFKLAPRASKTINFRVVVPESAEPGGHFGSIVFHTKLPSEQNNTSIGVGQEIGGLLLLKVAGTVKERASIANFESAKDIWEGSPIQFETRFQNSGNIQLKPSGTVTVSNMFGQKVGSASLDSRTVLPGSTRRIPTSWNGDAWPGWYTATASIGYGSKGQLITATTNFVIFPYKVIVPVLLVLIALGVLVFRARRRLWRSIKILFGKE